LSAAAWDSWALEAWFSPPLNNNMNFSILLFFVFF
jgi:hypothetical protein